MMDGIFNGSCIFIGVCVIVTLHWCAYGVVIHLQVSLMAQLQIVKSAAVLPIFSPMLDEDQLLHVKSPASGCRVLATHGLCNPCEGGKSATSSGQEFLAL